MSTVQKVPIRYRETLEHLDLEVERLHDKNTSMSDALKTLYPHNAGEDMTTIHESLDRLVLKNTPEALLKLEQYYEALKIQVVEGDPKNLFHLLADEREHQEIMHRVWEHQKRNEGVLSSIKSSMSRAIFGQVEPEVHVDVSNLTEGWYIKLPQSAGIQQKRKLNIEIRNKNWLGVPNHELENMSTTKKGQKKVTLTYDELSKYLNARAKECNDASFQKIEHSAVYKEADQSERADMMKDNKTDGKINIAELWTMIDKVKGTPNKVYWDVFVEQAFDSDYCDMERANCLKKDIEGKDKFSVFFFLFLQTTNNYSFFFFSGIK